jgi:hypothetical protein
MIRKLCPAYKISFPNNATTLTYDLDKQRVLFIIMVINCTKASTMEVYHVSWHK